MASTVISWTLFSGFAASSVTSPSSSRPSSSPPSWQASFSHSSRRASSRVDAPSFRPRFPRTIRPGFWPRAETSPCVMATWWRSRLAQLSLKARRRQKRGRKTSSACRRLCPSISSLRPLLRGFLRPSLTSPFESLQRRLRYQPYIAARVRLLDGLQLACPNPQNDGRIGYPTTFCDFFCSQRVLFPHLQNIPRCRYIRRIDRTVRKIYSALHFYAGAALRRWPTTCCAASWRPAR